jgi:hypothetical protein
MPAATGTMTLADLRSQFRLLTDSGAVPSLWADSEVDRLINLAYLEAADRGMLIFDRASYVITTVADTAEYALEQPIVRIKRAWLVGQTVDGVTAADQPIFTLTSDEVLDWTRWYRFGGDIMFQTVSFGTLRYGVTEDRGFILVPTPTEVREIKLEVWRLPKALLVDSTDAPEFEPIYHQRLLSWALYLAYSIPESETIDQVKADKYAAEFERDFGSPKNARQRRAALENRVLRVRPSPF